MTKKKTDDRTPSTDGGREGRATLDAAEIRRIASSRADFVNAIDDANLRGEHAVLRALDAEEAAKAEGGPDGDGESAPEDVPDEGKARALALLRELDDEADLNAAPLLAETELYFEEHEEKMAEAWARRRRSDHEGEDPPS